MLAIDVSIPNLKVARIVRFWPRQFKVQTTNMYVHNWLTEQEHRRLMNVGESELEKRTGSSTFTKMATWGG